MSTDTLTLTVSDIELMPTVEVRFCPVEVYRRSVFSGDYSQDVCEAAERLRHEWEADRRLYRQRQDAATALAQRLPILEAEAAEAEKLATATLPPLCDSMTLGELRRLIAGIAPTAKTSTPEELAYAICKLPAEPLRRQAAAAQARDQVNFTRRSAEQVLFETAAKPPANSEADRLRSLIVDVENRIAARQPILTADRQVQDQRHRIDDIMHGRVSIVDVNEWSRAHWAGPPAGDQVRRENRRLLQEAKAELSRLLALSKQRPAAEKANQADQGELARLQVDLQKAESETRQWQLRPENMAWCE